MKFVLLASSHNQDGKTYKKGDRIESDVDLVALFGKDKFRRAGVKYVEIEDEEEEELGEEEAKPVKKPAAKAADETKKSSKKSAKKVKEEDTEEEDAEAEKVESKLGDDVTSKYPRASSADLLILKKGKKLFIADKDDPDTALNEDPIHTDEELNEALDGFTKPE